MLARRLLSLVAALVLACASTQTHAYARALLPESALPARASLSETVPGQSAAVSHDCTKENWHPPLKCAAGEHEYANNNPYTFVDPDGRCAAKTGTRICIHAKNFNSARSTGRSAQGSATMDRAVKAQRGEVRTKAGARQEQLGSLNRQSDESLKVEKIANAETGRTKTADTASGNPPGNAQAIVHGHITESVADDRNSRGDAGAVVVLQKPNYAVAQDGRVIVHEVVDGRYQVRMVEGRMSNAEVRHFKSEVNERQESFYDRDN